MGNTSLMRRQSEVCVIDTTDCNIQTALVRERDRHSRLGDVYEVLELIGQGGICKVYKIRKLQSAIGGSSREPNIRKKHRSLFQVTSSDQLKLMAEYLPEPNTAVMDFAMKEIDMTDMDSAKREQLLTEVKILKALDHKNIIRGYETFKLPRKLQLVMELCTGGDLTSRFPYSEQSVKNITRQIVSAIHAMHCKSIIHRDIKLENIMFEDPTSETIKVIDFGLSKAYDDNLSERVGTLYSMSPETLRGKYTTTADCWSIGVCVYYLLSSTQPFDGEKTTDLVRRILKAAYNFDDPVWRDCSRCSRDFIKKLLVRNPEKRMDCEGAKKHPWLLYHEFVIDESLRERVRERMLEFSQRPEFWKLALNVIAKKTSAQEITKLRELFERFDSDNSGCLGLREFKRLIKSPDAEEIFRAIDVNNSNAINFTEFLASALEVSDLGEYHFAEAFDLLDTDDSGYISRRNLKSILGNVGDRYINQLMAEADFLKDGRISYWEFLHVFDRSS